ncbi:hypothetical protein Rs2_44182 [Raphanus sativus]|nr:hypothetical protein Rs2_44182 [Raphanus sativus]
MLCNRRWRQSSGKSIHRRHNHLSTLLHPLSVVYLQEPAAEHTKLIDAREVASIDCYTNNDGWNSEFHYKPKYGARAHDTHMGQKRSWSDTSEDPATQRRKAIYTHEEVDRMISKLYTALEDAEEEYHIQFNAVYETFDENFDTLHQGYSETTCTSTFNLEIDRRNTSCVA